MAQCIESFASHPAAPSLILGNPKFFILMFPSLHSLRLACYQTHQELAGQSSIGGVLVT